jgi:transcriptional antiterminator NusG
MEDTHFYLLRTTTTQEDAVVDMLYQKASETPDSGVYAIIHPGTIKGYVFMEARDLGDAIQLVQGVPHTKGFVKGEVDFEKEVKSLLQPKSSVLDVKKGDLIELIAGPFKGEKAKVIRVDESKEEVTVELIEATVPIPVTAKGMHVKVVDRVTQEKAEESQRRDRERKGPVIGEGPLPALRSRGEEPPSYVKPSSEPTRPETAEPKPKKIVFGMGAEEPVKEKDVEAEAEKIDEEEFDEEKAAEEDAKVFGEDDKDDELDK